MKQLERKDRKRRKAKKKKTKMSEMNLVWQTINEREKKRKKLSLKQDHYYIFWGCFTLFDSRSFTHTHRVYLYRHCMMELVEIIGVESSISRSYITIKIEQESEK